jgi:hypothetical protein
LPFDLAPPILRIKHFRQSGYLLKTNNQDSDKDSQEIDDILSNPETFGIMKQNLDRI